MTDRPRPARRRRTPPPPRGKREQPASRSWDRRLAQLAVSAVLLLAVVVVKITAPSAMDRYRDRLLDLMAGQTDFRAAFSAVGRAVSGQGAVGKALNDAYTAVFGPQDTGVTVPQDAADPAAYTAENTPGDVCLTQQVLGFAYAAPVQGTVTDGFGWRENAFHYGTDIAADAGTVISSFADGTVTAVGDSSQLGNYVTVSHAGLLLSWVLALVHVPLMANRLLKQPSRTEGSGKLYDSTLYRRFGDLLRFGLRHRIAALSVILVLLGLSVWGFRYVRQGFFPDMVYDQLYIEYKLPEGTNSTRVAADLREIEAYLKTRPEIRNVVASVGGTPARYNLVRSIATPSLSYGELIVDFESPESLVENMDVIQEDLSARYPDAYVKVKRYNIMFKKYPIEVQFSGPDPAVLHRLADSARMIMARTPQVAQITTGWEPAVPVLAVDYHQAAARRANLSRQDIATSLLTAEGGIPVGTFYEGVHRNTIYLKCTAADGSRIDNPENVPVFPMLPNVNALLDDELVGSLQTGTLDKGDIIRRLAQTIPLGQVGRGVGIRWEDPVIPRYNGQRMQSVMCSPAPGVETEAARQTIAEQIEDIPLPTGYSIRWDGEKGARDQTMYWLFKQVPLAVVLIIAVLILLFGDYRKPTIVLCCIPLLAVGIVGAMLLTGKTFDFCAIVGALGLMGMLIKNCIVLLDEIGQRCSGDTDLIAGLVVSAQSRLRPVMMASLTTILGMIPLLGDAMFGSMAATIMGGLFFSTIATLLFLPILYALFFKIKTK